MKANKFHNVIIMLHSLWIMLSYSLLIIIRSSFGCLSREIADKTIHIWAKKLLKVVGVSKNISRETSLDIIPGRRYILMSNHASHYDIPLIISTFPEMSIRMIGKKELFSVPIWGKALHKAEFMSIDRQNRRQALKDLEVAKEKLASGITTWVAPEGTRTRTGEMGELKKGGIVLAIQTEAIIIPVGIKGSHKILPPDTWQFSTQETVDMNVGKPIDAKEYTLKQRNELLEKVKTALHALTA